MDLGNNTIQQYNGVEHLYESSYYLYQLLCPFQKLSRFRALGSTAENPVQLFPNLEIQLKSTFIGR